MCSRAGRLARLRRLLAIHHDLASQNQCLRFLARFRQPALDQDDIQALLQVLRFTMKSAICRSRSARSPNREIAACAGQIDWKLRTDTRVILHERVNARYLLKTEIGESVSLLACDVSFISVTLLIPALLPLVDADGDWIILVKPQFEAGREFVESGGIVRDPTGHRFACERVSGAMRAAGFDLALRESPILGGEGNREFLLHAWRTAT